MGKVADGEVVGAGKDTSEEAIVKTPALTLSKGGAFQGLSLSI